MVFMKIALLLAVVLILFAIYEIIGLLKKPGLIIREKTENSAVLATLFSVSAPTVMCFTTTTSLRPTGIRVIPT